MRAEHFAGRLKELRERADWSQKELAGRSGLTVRQVSRLETGAQKPSWESVLALAEALGVDCRDFLEKPAPRPEPKRGRPKRAAGDRPTWKGSTSRRPRGSSPG